METVSSCMAGKTGDLTLILCAIFFLAGCFITGVGVMWGSREREK